MELSTLKQFVKKAPAGPGIYRYLASDGQILYIGKAASIKKRLNSYFKTEDGRIRQMIDRAAKIEFVETDSDIEALILESQLIKKDRPMFNVMLRDDKQYFYVSFSNDEFPKIFLTHQPTSGAGRVLGSRPGEPVPSVPPKGSPSATGSKNRPAPESAEFIGPFTDGVALKATLKFLRNVFPYCTCKQLHHNHCLNYHIGKCLGFCCLKTAATAEQVAQYYANVGAIKDILNGKKNALVKELTERMDRAARADDFTGAIAIRGQLAKLERVFENARIIKNSEILKEYRSGLPALLKTKKPIIRIEGYDISNIQGAHATGSMVTFVNNQPDKDYYRKFNIKTVRGANDTAMLGEILERRLNHSEWPYPDLILMDGGKGQVNAARATLAALNVSIPVIGLSKDDKHFGKQLIIPGRKLPLKLEKLSPADKNLLLSVDTEAHRFAIGHYRHRHARSLKESSGNARIENS